MHVGIFIQPVDQRQQVLLAGARIELVLVGIHSGLDGLLALAAHVDLARRVFADQHHGKPRGHRMLLFQKFDFARDLSAQIGGERLSVNDLGHDMLAPD